MSYLIQRTTGRNLTLIQVTQPVLRIGRGTNQDLRSENPAVALEHAVIESDAAGYVITDKGSITGTYVNGKPVESHRLVKGDAVEIGDLRLEIQLADPAKPLFLRVVAARSAVLSFEDEEEEAAPKAAAAPVKEGKRVVRSKKIDYAGAYRLHRPWLTKLSITAILLIIALGVIGELVRPERQTVFMPGGVSSAHTRLVATNCDACHTPWKSVSGAKCNNCHHKQDVHAKFEKDPPECFTCHAEHRGKQKLAAISDERCVGCHTDLFSHSIAPRAQLASLKFAQDRYTFDDIARISTFGEKTHPEFRYPADPNTLRFNHKLHLAPKGIFSGTGKRQVLECTGCHELVERRGKVDPEPIDFEEHCQSCHKLTFDPNYPNAQVPHGGDPNIVYGFVGSYAGDPSIASRSPAEIRRLLTARRQVTADARAVYAAAQVIKGKCQKCHDIETRGTRLAIKLPVIRDQWVTHAKFTHTKHRSTPCETCHGTARESARTSDVAMPSRANCTSCHAPDSKVARDASTCVTCHEYHLRPQIPISALPAQAGMGGLGSGGRMFQGILLAAIVILLLVVLVPVGIALFQRLRREPAAPAPRSAAAAPPPRVKDAPTMKIVKPDAPTDKVERKPAPPPDIAAPAPPRPEPTRSEPMPQEMRTEAAAGTEMLQWYGMLHCTTGPLEGQRFVVEDEGFWIGRDPALAKIVVNDSRVSKRHVRIVPRDGRVWAIDEGSTNGTFLASAPGVRITEVQLKRGDVLVLGDNAATFTYQI